MFCRVLVANRGEIAVRVIRALHELGVEAVAVYSTADRDALHVRLADQAVCIGPPAAARELPRGSRNVVAAAETTGCEAVHPGLRLPRREPGVRARLRGERPRLRRPVARRDGATRRQGAGEGRDARRRRPARAGHARASRRSRRCARPPTRSAFRCCSRPPPAAAARACASSTPPDELEAAFGAASAEAEAAFGDGSLYLEKALVPGPPRRDPGAVRRPRRRAHARRARVLDPAPPPEARRGVAVARARPRETREAMEAAVERACRAVGYVNAGTFEFLLGPDGEPVLHRGQLPPPGRAPRHASW